MAQLDEVISPDACNSGRKVSASTDVEQREARQAGCFLAALICVTQVISHGWYLWSWT